MSDEGVGEGLPAYDEHRQPGGAKRWRAWAEKRALESKQERKERTNLEATESSEDYSSQQLLSAEQEQAHFARLRITNEDDEELSQSSNKFPRLERDHRSIQLTTSIALHSLGSRFVSILPSDSEPLCAAVLQLESKSPAFIFIGTAVGLFVLDLFPMHSEVKRSNSASLEDCKVACVWKSGPIRNIAVTKSGLTIMLIESEETGADVLQWNAQDIINLCRWSLLSDSHVPVDLGALLRGASPTTAKSRRQRFRLSVQRPRSKSSVEATPINDYEHIRETDLEGWAPENSQYSSLKEQTSEWAAAYERIAIQTENVAIKSLLLHDVPHQEGCQLLVLVAEETIVVLTEDERAKLKLLREFSIPDSSRSLGLSLVTHDKVIENTSGQLPALPAYLKHDQNELSLLVGLGSKLVAIRLADSAVSELEPFGPCANSTSKAPREDHRNSVSKSHAGEVSISRRSSLRLQTEKLAKDPLGSLRMVLSSSQDRPQQWSASLRQSFASAVNTTTPILAFGRRTVICHDPLQSSLAQNRRTIEQPVASFWKHPITDVVRHERQSAKEMKQLVVAFHSEGFEVQETTIDPRSNNKNELIDGDSYQMSFGRQTTFLCDLPQLNTLRLSSENESVRGFGASLLSVEAIGEFKLYILA